MRHFLSACLLLLVSAGASAAAESWTCTSTANGTMSCAATVPPVAPPVVPPAGTWTQCANEWGTCNFVGTQSVRYGAEGKYAYKTATGSVACTNAVFTDPAPGLGKACAVTGTVVVPPVTPPVVPPANGTGPFGQDASKYTLVFADDFSGTSLDTTKWNNHVWYDPASDANDYGVSGGMLKIWPQATSTGEYHERIVTTKDKFEPVYGYFEARMKLPYGSGLWPAFWLLHTADPDNGEPEIDIMEAYSGDKTGYWANAQGKPIKYGASWYDIGANHGGNQGTHHIDTPDLSADFHRYALLWEPGRLTFFFDGKQVHTVAVTMTKPMSLLVNLQYGSASGKVDSTTPLGPGNAVETDYVRVWKAK